MEMPFHSRCISDAKYLCELSVPRFGTPISDSTVHKFEEWKRQIGVDDSTFAERLLSEGHTIESFLAILESGGSAGPLAKEHDDWETCLVEFSHELLGGALWSKRIESLAKELEKEGYPAFSGWLVPMVLYGDLLLTRSLTSEHLALVAPARTDLWRSLARRLLRLAGRTLTLELNIARLSGGLQCDTPKSRYDFFCEVHLRDPKVIMKQVQTYPVLYRLCIQTIMYWVKFVAEFITRLYRDRDKISLFVSSGTKEVEINHFELDLSDPHQGGRTVIIVGFDSGYRVVYKPKELKICILFQELLNLLNSMGCPHPHRTLDVLDCGKYAWVEWLPHRQCKNEREVESFFWRQGSLLALSYILSGNDLHLSNVIAHGMYPVLIDLETIIHNRTKKLPALDGTARSQMLRSLEHSVMWSGLLPELSFHEYEESYDLSALSDDYEKMWPIPFPTIERIQRDDMYYVNRQQPGIMAENRPLYKGEPADPYIHRNQVVAGFRWTYKVIANFPHRFSHFLSQMPNCKIRYIARGTVFYDSILQTARHPDYMQLGLDRDRILDTIWNQAFPRPELQDVLVAEKRDLRIEDIPIFFSRLTETALEDSSGAKFDGFFPVSCLELTQDIISNLNDDDLAIQSFLIEQALNSKRLSRIRRDYSYVTELSSGDSGRCKSGIIHNTAFKVARRLIHTSVTRKDDVSWLDAVESEVHLQVKLRPCEANLYDGVAGIAFSLGYLAALHEKGRECTALAEKCAALMMHQLERTPPKKIEDWAAFSGRSGLIYSLIHLGHTLRYRKIDKVLWSTPLPNIELVREDRTLDLIGGSAGIALVLVRLYEATQRQDALNLAREVGYHLIESTVSTRYGQGWICDQFGMPITGFGHGAGGMAYALSELYRLTGERCFLDTAERGIDFERNTYDKHTGHWRDLRPSSNGQELSLNAWCHGRPGILLARGLVLNTVGTCKADSVLRHQIGPILADQGMRSQSLCHGSLGNMDIVLSLAHICGQEEWKELVVENYARIASDYESGYWRSGLLSLVETPGLMLGLAGLAVGLLRARYPELVPSVLFLQGPPRNRQLST